MTLVILIGGIDLSVGAVVALIGTLTVWLLPQAAWRRSVAAGLAAASAFGAVNGRLAARTRHAAVHHHPGDDAASPGARPCGSTRAGRSPCRRPQEAFLALGNARVLRRRARAGAGDGGGLRRHGRAAPPHPVRPAPLRHRRQPRGGPLHGHPPGAERDRRLRRLLAPRRARRHDPRLAALLGRARRRARASSSTPSPRWSSAGRASPEASARCPARSSARSSSASSTRA